VNATPVGRCTCLGGESVSITSCQCVADLPADLAPCREAVADAGLPGGPASVDEPLGGPGVAIRASRKDHPSRGRAAS
jgi:hypothetical protein